MELGKEIGWIRPKNTDGGEYDDSLIKSQIEALDGELDKVQDDIRQDISNKADKSEINRIDESLESINGNIPTKTSELTNDSGFLTAIPSEYVTETELNQKGYSTFNGDYNNLTNKPTIPSEYVTDSELNAKGYATQTYVQNEITKVEGELGKKLTLGIHTDGMLYIFSDNQPVGRGVQLGSSDAPILGYVDSENNVVLSGNLYNGNYTIKYETEDGTLIDIGSLTLEELESPPTVEPGEETNYFDIKTALLNHRLGSSGSPSAFNGMLVTDYIPVNSTMHRQRFSINGVTLIKSSNYNYSVRVVYYDTSKNMVDQNNYAGDVDESDYYVITVPDESFTEGYIRISLVLKDGEALSESDVSNLTILLR